MALYTNQIGELKEVKVKPFKLEKDIQKVFEDNLSAIMGLKLVKSEFTSVSNQLYLLEKLQPTKFTCYYPLYRNGSRSVSPL